MANDSATRRLGDSAQTPAPPPPNTHKFEYLGVGCFSAFVGFAGGGMIAVLIAKIVGAAQRCPADAETGAPCNWFTYMFFGMITGFVIVPIVSVWFFRRGRSRASNSRG
jgi:hypothetical protein